MTLALFAADIAEHAPRAALVVAATLGLGCLAGWVMWLADAIHNHGR